MQRRERHRTPNLRADSSRSLGVVGTRRQAPCVATLLRVAVEKTARDRGRRHCKQAQNPRIFFAKLAVRGIRVTQCAVWEEKLRRGTSTLPETVFRTKHANDTRKASAVSQAEMRFADAKWIIEKAEQGQEKEVLSKCNEEFSDPRVQLQQPRLRATTAVPSSGSQAAIFCRTNTHASGTSNCWRKRQRRRLSRRRMETVEGIGDTATDSLVEKSEKRTARTEHPVATSGQRYRLRQSTAPACRIAGFLFLGRYFSDQHGRA